MTRRDFVWTAVIAAGAAQSPVMVPVHRVVDARARCTPEQYRRFWWSIWPEAVRDFDACGVHFRTGDATGEIRRTPGDRPLFVGLERGVLNLVLTDHVPLRWDIGRALRGVTTLYEGYHLCLIALRYAHGHQVPFLSVNTCVHELLHALMQDIFESRPKGFEASVREFRIDAYATRLWLFHHGAAIRKSAQVYVDRLKGGGSLETPASRKPG